MRLKSEGAITTKGDELMDPEFYTTGKLLAQTLGFGSTEVAQVQKANFMAKQIVTKINRQKENRHYQKRSRSHPFVGGNRQPEGKSRTRHAYKLLRRDVGSN